MTFITKYDLGQRVIVKHFELFEFGIIHSISLFFDKIGTIIEYEIRLKSGLKITRRENEIID